MKVEPKLPAKSSVNAFEPKPPIERTSLVSSAAADAEARRARYHHNCPQALTFPISASQIKFRAEFNRPPDKTFERELPTKPPDKAFEFELPTKPPEKAFELELPTKPPGKLSSSSCRPAA